MDATFKPAAGVPTPALRRRALSASPYDGPAAETYKRDGRSRVWRVEPGAVSGAESGEASAYVVKRFEYAPLRQRLALTLGLHPAQRELRWNQALRAAGVPAVPIVDAGYEPVRRRATQPVAAAEAAPEAEAPDAGCGCRAWLVTPWLGASLQGLIRDASVSESRRREAVAAAAGLTRTLLRAGFTFRDLKPSNIVIDTGGTAHLLDVGSVRATTAPGRVARMLATMDRVMRRDGASDALRRAFAAEVDHPAEADAPASDRAERSA